jgi:hypothetical protein
MLDAYAHDQQQHGDACDDDASYALFVMVSLKD